MADVWLSSWHAHKHLEDINPVTSNNLPIKVIVISMSILYLEIAQCIKCINTENKFVEDFDCCDLDESDQELFRHS